MEQVKEILEKIETNTRSSAKSNREIANWVVFFGIITIIGLVVSAGAVLLMVM
tara:strand:- start:128 stop:286 length:159 start_codon:yes stop_codon:yes gene_type:complete